MKLSKQFHLWEWIINVKTSSYLIFEWKWHILHWEFLIKRKEALFLSHAVNQLSPHCVQLEEEQHSDWVIWWHNTCSSLHKASVNLCLWFLQWSITVFWHDALPPECCSVSCRRSPSRQSLCPCTSRWRGSQWTPSRRPPAACWRLPGGRTTSVPGPWTTRTCVVQAGGWLVGAAAVIICGCLVEHRHLSMRHISLKRSAAKSNINTKKTLLDRADRTSLCLPPLSPRTLYGDW